MLELPPGRASLHPVFFAVSGFLVGLLLTSAWFLESRLPRAGEATKPVATTSEQAVASLETPSEGILTVHDQTAGTAVLVDSVHVAKPGVWVAIEELKGDAFGNILGAARVSVPAESISVPLLRATVPGQTYAVVLYRDNGDGSFDAATDSLYVDFNTDKRVVALFKTTL